MPVHEDFLVGRSGSGSRSHLKISMIDPVDHSSNHSLINASLAEWQTLEKYRLQEDSLGLLFREFCPENKKIEHVLLKVCALNDFYSTNIFDTYSVAKHVLEMDIDNRLRSGDCSLVNELAIVTIKGKKKNFYSFASKYCSHHQPERFPIFDSFVERLMMHYKKEHGFAKFRKAELKDYKRFIEIIRGFQKFYGLESFSLREIDIYLWLAGKRMFPKKY